MEREKVLGFIKRAYTTACSHGFHDVDRSDAYFMMLVISEIGEMVEADRRNRRFDMEKYRNGFDSDKVMFEKYVKDTLEDELADVVIRIFDFCGLRKITPAMSSKGVLDMQDEFKRIFGGMTTCEQCFGLSCLVCDVGRYGEEWEKERMEREIGSILSFCFDFAKFHGFDLEWHIERKMRFNEDRPRKHGKEY